MVANGNSSSLINTLSALINLSFRLSKRLPFAQFAQMLDSLQPISAGIIIFHSDSSLANIRHAVVRWSGAVEMETGESFFLLLPNLQGSPIEMFLSEFARAKGLGKKDRGFAVGRRTGTSRAVKSSGRNRISISFAMYARVESK